MTDLARRAGVSKNTVSLALRNDPQISTATRRKIQALAARMNYRPNATVAHLMAELRRSRSRGHQATLALLNANTDEAAFTRHPTIPSYVHGCREHAAQLGYGLDEFWLHDPRLDGSRLNAILRARGIRGAVAVGLMNKNRLPDRFAQTWQEVPCVVTGVRTREPALPFACVDHYLLARQAMEKCLALGYRRPALVLDHTIDQLVDGRFSAGVFMAQQSLPLRQRTRPFYAVTESRTRTETFARWLERESPDVLLTLYNVVRHWVVALGRTVPDNLGLVQLEWRADRPDWAGMNQHNDRAGRAAVEMVVNRIHNPGLRAHSLPEATLIGPSWVEGNTVRNHSSSPINIKTMPRWS